MRLRLTLVSVLLILTSAFLGRLYFKDAHTQTTQVAVVHDKGTRVQAQIGGDFRLIDHTGTARTPADFKGRFLLIYFGYSFCPDICPTALYSMTQALDSLGKRAAQIAPVFITVDPERDTQAHLARYIQNYHPQFLALTGPQTAIEQAMRAYKVQAMRAKPDGTTTDYLVDHSSIIYLMDRQGRFISHFNHQTSPEVLADALRKALGDQS